MDRRRIVGPETSTSPVTRGAEDAGQAAPRKLAAKRADGRLLDDLRPVCEYRQYTAPPVGKTVEGLPLRSCGAFLAPDSPSRGAPTLLCTRQDAQERDFSTTLREALAPSVRLDLLPKSSIDIYVDVLEADGMASCLAAAITCASVALADAGIEMLDMVAASSASVIGNRIYLDATEDEERDHAAWMMISYMPSLDEVTHVVMSGELETGLAERVSALFFSAAVPCSRRRIPDESFSGPPSGLFRHACSSQSRSRTRAPRCMP
ncbi:MAG: hypothetical protein BJ554DRAFT_2849 [Olpidium bornovanus]|uniref:Uncharacterized protein n=1 Tax=Olpidium bornovanus TaxID=278681 RepID=A0A8H7ZQ67_9FUNG|nr:MAG: hypothetical protein BJ554DRAFT_2849 [Olpidium bornovanus]